MIGLECNLKVLSKITGYKGSYSEYIERKQLEQSPLNGRVHRNSDCGTRKRILSKKMLSIDQSRGISYCELRRGTHIYLPVKKSLIQQLAYSGFFFIFGCFQILIQFNLKTPVFFRYLFIFLTLVMVFLIVVLTLDLIFKETVMAKVHIVNKEEKVITVQRMDGKRRKYKITNNEVLSALEVGQTVELYLTKRTQLPVQIKIDTVKLEGPIH
ncbi:hypothetical protein D3C73_1077900 [compost metagenome]